MEALSRPVCVHLIVTECCAKCRCFGSGIQLSCQSAHLPQWQAGNIHSVDQNAAASKVDHAEQRHEQGGLARASAANNAHLAGAAMLWSRLSQNFVYKSLLQIQMLWHKLDSCLLHEACTGAQQSTSM